MQRGHASSKENNLLTGGKKKVYYWKSFKIQIVNRCKIYGEKQETRSGKKSS